jgi:hypothetical protein
MVSPELADGLAKLRFAAVILNDDVSGPAFLFDRPLGLFPVVKFLFGPTPPEGSFQS